MFDSAASLFIYLCIFLSVVWFSSNLKAEFKNHDIAIKLCYALNTFKYKTIKKGFAEKLFLFLNEGGSGHSLNASLFHTFKLKCPCVSEWMSDIPARS